MRLLSVGFRYFEITSGLGIFFLGVQDSRVTKYICTCPIATKTCQAGNQDSIPGAGVVLFLLCSVKDVFLKENFVIRIAINIIIKNIKKNYSLKYVLFAKCEA